MEEKSDTIYGRHRQSLTEIDEELQDIFREHPECYENAEGKSVLPAKCLVDVFDTYEREFGVELITRDEMQKMIELVETTPGLEATPEMLLQLVAMRSTTDNEEERGRIEERRARRRSRSSSLASNGTYHPGSRPPSRPPSRGSNVPPSPFDAQKRQRAAPLSTSAAPPSSWTKRPVAPARRKSDAGSQSRNSSDPESSTSSFSNSTSGRRRTPSSGPTSAGVSPDASFEISSSADGPYSRPHSRSHSSQGLFGGSVRSPQAMDGRNLPPHLDLSRSVYDAFENQVSSLPMPRNDKDGDSDEEVESALGLVMDRSARSSVISMDDDERIDVLQKSNQDLTKKLIESERILQNSLADHEQQLIEMEQKLEEAHAELMAAKREEKELRSAERTHSQQISALELEVSKLQKALDSSRAAYSQLQRQYQEQLGESEALRNQLRRKEEQVQEFGNSLSLMELEQSKWQKEHDQYEERVAVLEQEIEIAQETQRSLDEQKHENLMLKETIDRMRFDMDELRNGLASHTTQSNGSSLPGSISKSLGAELASKMRDGEGWMDEEEVPSTIIEDVEIEAENSEDEDVVQTIITRKKRRGTSKANMIQQATILHEKEYADAYTQYDPLYFHSASSAQTDPEPRVITASLGVQVEYTAATTDVQTETTPPKVMTEIDVQTETFDEPTPSSSRLSTPQLDDDSMASSSSTIMPATPKAKIAEITSDLPPSYNDAASQSLFHNLEHLLEASDLSFSHVNDPETRRELIAAAAAIRRCHKGLQLPMRVDGASVSAEAAAEWTAIKQELGVGCAVIDKAISNADMQQRKGRRGRFYNIYNTYVYGTGSAPWISQLLLAGAASAVVFAAMSPFLVQYQTVPGGPTYYDRLAWQSFNNMHGGADNFPNEGTAAVWSFIGRLGGGAARVVRNWPT